MAIRRCRALIRASAVVFAALGAMAAPAAAAFVPVMSGTVRLPDGRLAPSITLEAAAQREDFTGSTCSVRLWAGQLGSGSLFTIRTDAHGHYQAKLVRDTKSHPVEGDRAKFSGFLISPTGAGWAPLALEVRSRHRHIRLDVRLRAGDQVSGVVLAYPGAHPLPGAKVHAVIWDGFHSPCILYSAAADSSGRFAIPVSLPPGRCMVFAAAGSYGFLAEERETEGARAMARSRELTLRLIHDFLFRGQVLTADGHPFGDRSVTILVDGDKSNVEKPGAEFGTATRTDSEGRFSFTFHGHATYIPLSDAYRNLTIRAKSGRQVSNRVTVDAIAASEATVVLTMP